MKIYLWPKRGLGIFSALAGILFIILMILKIKIDIPLSIIVISMIGLIGFLTALICLIYKEHAVFVYLSVLNGFLIFAWSVAESVYPH